MKRFLIMLLAILMLIPTTEVQAAKKKKVKIATPTYEIRMTDPDHTTTDEEIESGEATGLFQIKFKCKTKGVKIKMIQEPIDDQSVPTGKWVDFLHGDDWDREYMSDAMEYQHRIFSDQKLTFYAYKGKNKSKKVTINASEIVTKMYADWADKSKTEYYEMIKSDMSGWVDEDADDVTKIIGICKYFRDSGKFEYVEHPDLNTCIFEDSKRSWNAKYGNCLYLATVFAHACHAYNIDCVEDCDSDDESYFVNDHAWNVLSLNDGIIIADPTLIVNNKMLYYYKRIINNSNWSPSYTIIEAAVNGGN